MKKRSLHNKHLWGLGAFRGYEACSGKKVISLSRSKPCPLSLSALSPSRGACKCARFGSLTCCHTFLAVFIISLYNCGASFLVAAFFLQKLCEWVTDRQLYWLTARLTACRNLYPSVRMLQGLAINIHRLFAQSRLEMPTILSTIDAILFASYATYVSCRLQSHNKCCRCCSPIYATKAVKLYKSLVSQCLDVSGVSGVSPSAIFCQFIELHFLLCAHTCRPAPPAPKYCYLWPTKGHRLRHKNKRPEIGAAAI